MRINIVGLNKLRERLESSRKEILIDTLQREANKIIESQRDYMQYLCFLYDITTPTSERDEQDDYSRHPHCR
jgi:hypothetical protein